jgi:hypothetical protein
MNKGMGNWEKHTRGIGAKILLQVSERNINKLGYMLNYCHTPFIDNLSVPAMM